MQISDLSAKRTPEYHFWRLYLMPDHFLSKKQFSLKAITGRFFSRPNRFKFLTNYQKDILSRSMKSIKQPESIPSLLKWDISVTHVSSTIQITVFDDIFRKDRQACQYFFLLESSNNDLESMIHTHVVRRELINLDKGTLNLDQITRHVHEKALSAAQIARNNITGITGMISSDAITLLPLHRPGFLLKRKQSSQVLSLKDLGYVRINPKMGGVNFDTSDLQTLEVAMNSGDIAAIYSHSLTSIKSTDGDNWGTTSIADILTDSHESSAKNTLARIINSAESFTGLEEIAEPLQLVVMRRR